MVLYFTYITATEYGFASKISSLMGLESVFFFCTVNITMQLKENTMCLAAIKNDSKLKYSSRRANAKCMQISHVIHVLIWCAER